MLVVTQGVNRIVVPRLDLPVPLPAATMLRMENPATKRIVWCQVADSAELVDWVDFRFNVIGSGADPVQSQVAMTAKDKGEWDAMLYGGTVYSQSPSELTELRKERFKLD
jgi:hypothetical protein